MARGVFLSISLILLVFAPRHASAVVINKINNCLAIARMVSQNNPGDAINSENRDQVRASLRAFRNNVLNDVEHYPATLKEVEATSKSKAAKQKIVADRIRGIEKQLNENGHVIGMVYRGKEKIESYLKEEKQLYDINTNEITGDKDFNVEEVFPLAVLTGLSVAPFITNPTEITALPLPLTLLLLKTGYQFLRKDWKSGFLNESVALKLSQSPANYWAFDSSNFSQQDRLGATDKLFYIDPKTREPVLVVVSRTFKEKPKFPRRQYDWSKLKDLKEIFAPAGRPELIPLRNN